MGGPFERFSRLPEFPFRRLTGLLESVPPAAGTEPIDLSIGEPRHTPPKRIAEAVAANSHLWNRYPPPSGTPEFRRAARDWLVRRFDLPADLVDPDRNLLPLAGTKEGLFLLPSVLEAGENAVVLMPSPLYSVYAGAAAMAGASPVGLPALPENGFLPDIDGLEPSLLERTVAFFLCSPANPQGAVADQDYLCRLLELARRHDFLLVMDECYSEIYDDAPPMGGLEAAASLGEGTRPHRGHAFLVQAFERTWIAQRISRR